MESELSSSVVKAILSAIDKHLSSSPIGQHPNWWKVILLTLSFYPGRLTLFLPQVHEACLLALEVVISNAEEAEGSEKLDFQAFVQNVVFPDLASGGEYFTWSR